MQYACQWCNYRRQNVHHFQKSGEKKNASRPGGNTKHAAKHNHRVH